MKKIFLLLVFFFAVILNAISQNYFWVGFTDKNNTGYSLDNPEEYLSERAIQRRSAQSIAIDSLDLPVNKLYVDSILSLGVNFVHSSKWLNGITVSSSYETLDFLKEWAFVDEVQLTKPRMQVQKKTNKFLEKELFVEPIDTLVYGGSVHQVGMLNGQYLHNDGYKGQGMQVAVLDAGFYKADEYQAFDSLWANNQILGTRDFVNPNSDFFMQHYHGMSVLSCMGGNVPGRLIGTAPKASYWLLRSEDDDSEYIIEEDNWIAAAEFADSVGVDVINSSLGYYEFEDSSTDHTYADMDGHTTRVTRGANIAASRGILVFCSAGNERNKVWQRIIAPSDGDDVIAVGAVDKYLNPTSFTSAGPASDGDVKPNVAAMGGLTTLQGAAGSIVMLSGTSFSSPVMAGMAASLWSKFPGKTAVEIKSAIEQSASQYEMPDSLLGYGIPDMQVASELLDATSSDEIKTAGEWRVYPNPVSDYLILHKDGICADNEIKIQLYSLDGRNMKTWEYGSTKNIVLKDWSGIGSGIYLLRVSSSYGVVTYKISKQN